MAKGKEVVRGKIGRKVGYLVRHKACGTEFWRTPEQLKSLETCGVCKETDVKLEQVIV